MAALMRFPLSLVPIDDARAAGDPLNWAFRSFSIGDKYLGHDTWIVNAAAPDRLDRFLGRMEA